MSANELTECLPARLRRDLPGHEVQTVPRAGWAGVKNGKLLLLIADCGKFDVFLVLVGRPEKSARQGLFTINPIVRARKKASNIHLRCLYSESYKHIKIRTFFKTNA